jgi:hypothetical protein
MTLSGPEAEILVTGASAQLDDAARTRLLQQIAAGVDWTALTAMALEHGVANRVFSNLLSCAVAAVPKEIAAAASHYLEEERLRGAAFVGELFAIIDALAARHIATIPFKGPLLASLVYGDIAARHFTDLDFLLRVEAMPLAQEVLAGLGYRVDTDLPPEQEAAFRHYSGQVMFFAAKGRAPIEPHWALCQRTLAFDLDYEGLWRRAIEVRFEGRSVLCFAPEDMLIALALNGAKDEWSRLQPICDVAEFIRVKPDLAWPVALERAQSQGVLRVMRIALLLARDVMGARLPDAAEPALAGDAVAPRLAAEVRRRLFRADRRESSIYELSRLRFAMRERLRDRLRYVVRTVTTPRTKHFKLMRLPSALLFLYRPIKLGHDYVALPLWLAWKAWRTR